MELCMFHYKIDIIVISDMTGKKVQLNELLFMTTISVTSVQFLFTMWLLLAPWLGAGTIFPVSLHR